MCLIRVSEDLFQRRSMEWSKILFNPLSPLLANLTASKCQAYFLLTFLMDISNLPWFRLNWVRQSARECSRWLIHSDLCRLRRPTIAQATRGSGMYREMSFWKSVILYEEIISRILLSPINFVWYSFSESWPTLSRISVIGFGDMPRKMVPIELWVPPSSNVWLVWKNILMGGFM